MLLLTCIVFVPSSRAAAAAASAGVRKLQRDTRCGGCHVAQTRQYPQVLKLPIKLINRVMNTGQCREDGGRGGLLLLTDWWLAALAARVLGADQRHNDAIRYEAGDEAYGHVSQRSD